MEHDLYQDYKDLFGEEPGEVQGIAVKSRSNSTKSIAAADYNDFTLHAIEAKPLSNTAESLH